MILGMKQLAGNSSSKYFWLSKQNNLSRFGIHADLIQRISQNLCNPNFKLVELKGLKGCSGHLLDFCSFKGFFSSKAKYNEKVMICWIFVGNCLKFESIVRNYLQ